MQLHKLISALGLLVLLSTGWAAAQTYQLSFSSALGGNDTLLLTVRIRQTGATPFNLGASNVAFSFTDASCLDVTRASIRTRGLYTSPNPSYQTMRVANAATPGVLNLIVETTGAVSGIPVPNATPGLLATIAIPVLSCGCTVTPFVVDSLNGVAPYTPMMTPLLASDPAVVTPLNLAAPTIVSAVPPSPRTICGPGAPTTTYTSSAPGFWRIQSSVGSFITGNPNNTTTIEVQHGIPPGVSVTDVISVSPTQTSVCEQTFNTVLNPPPTLSPVLQIVGGATVCTGNPFTMRITNTELGVQYTLLRDGVPQGSPQTSASAGAALDFAVLALPAQTGPGYDFTYRAERAGCTVTQVGPGVEVSVIDCTLPTAIFGPSTITVCGDDTLTLRLTAPVPTATATWRVQNRLRPPVVQPALTTFGASVLFNVGVSAVQQVDTVIVTEVDGLASGTDEVYITVNPAANPVVTGPTFLFRPTPPGSVTGVFQLPVPLFKPTSVYTWSTIPALDPVNVSILPGPPTTSASLSFDTDGIYDVVLREVTAEGCIGEQSLRVQVSDCGANPGTTGPNSIVCTGDNTIVYVENDFSATGGVRWQRSTTSPTTGFVNVPPMEGFGSSSQVHVTAPVLTTTYYRLLATDTTGADCNNPSLPITVNAVAPPIAGLVTPRDTGVCDLGLITLRAVGGGGATLWQQSINGISWTTAAGTGVNTPVFTSLPLSSSIYYRALFGNACDSVSSNVVRINIFQEPEGTATAFTAPDDRICAGSTSIPIPNTVTSFGGLGLWTVQNGNGSVNAMNQYVSPQTDSTLVGPAVISWVVTSGTCTPDVNNVSLQVDGPSRARFGPITPTTICAGGGTDTLDAAILRGTQGVWSDGGAGGIFVPSNITPRALYISSLASAGSTVSLTWTVTNGACAPIAVTRTVAVNTNQIGGSFAPLTQPEICFGDQSELLNATNLPGTVANWSTTGTGGFLLDPMTMRFRYVPSAADQGTTVRLIWTITLPGCTPLALSRDLTVRRRPRAIILNADNNNVCVTDSIQLNAIELNGTGQWTTIVADPLDMGPNAAGTFRPNATTAGARYVPGASDANRGFIFVWTVDDGAGGCAAATDSIGVTVWGPPTGSFPSGIPNICAGSSTVPLNATVVSPQTGIWSTTNGDGTFSSLIDPGAFYNSELTDANQNITLVWTVLSPGCGTQAYTQNVFVNPSTVVGGFPGAPLPLPSICVTDSTAPLGATATLPSVGVWTVTGGSGTFSGGTSFGNSRYRPSPADAGDTLTLVWNVANPPCDNRTLTRDLYVGEPVTAFFPVPQTICFPNPSDTLRATISGELATGTWSAVPSSDMGYVGAGFFIPNVNSRNARYVPVTADVGRIIQLKWRVSNGICRPDSQLREVRVTGESVVAVMPTSATGCFGDTLTFTATGGDFYFWSGPGFSFITPTTAATVQVRSLGLGTGVLQLNTGAGSCIFNPRTVLVTTTAGDPITARQISPLDGAMMPVQVCIGQRAQLQVSATMGSLPVGGEISWQRDDGQPFEFDEIDNQFIATPRVRPSGNRVYRVRARTLNGCFGEATVTVNTLANTPPNIDDTIAVCLFNRGQDSTRIRPDYPTMAPPPGGERAYWYRGTTSVVEALHAAADSFQTGIFLSAGRNLLTIVPDSGNWPYTLYYASGSCFSYTTTYLKVRPAPDADFTADRLSVPFFNPVVNFTNTSTAPSDSVTYLWDFGDPASALNISTEANPTHRFSQASRFSVVLLINDLELQCSDLEVKTGYVTVLPERYLFPKAFTPDGQELTAVSDTNTPAWANERFRPLPLEGEPCVETMEIFDTKGNLVYAYTSPSGQPQRWTRDDRGFGWDGTGPNGQPMDVGTYAYRFVIRTKVNNACTGAQQTYTGSITLVR